MLKLENNKLHTYEYEYPMFQLFLFYHDSSTEDSYNNNNSNKVRN